MDFTPKLEQIRRNTSQIHNLLRDARLVACFGNRALLSLFVGGLIGQDHLVGAATCEAAGLALVEQHQPTMVFLSDTLEQGSGVALVQAIKQRWPTIHTLLLISQEQRQDAIKAAIEAGCDGLLVESRLGLGSAIAALTSSFPLWTGKPLAATNTQALLNSPVPIVPGLKFDTNLTGILAYYNDGQNQNTLSFSAGPILTLGHFHKPFLDYTQLAVTGGVTLRQGLSPLSFDRAVDLGTLNFGLTQQIAGPMLVSLGYGVNVDPASGFYGATTGSYVELRWQRRSYDIGVYYSPYEQLGGIRIRLNDFNFKGTGVPFVPYHPSQAGLRKPF
jgi:CheY-like chemotaxis protein